MTRGLLCPTVEHRRPSATTSEGPRIRVSFLYTPRQLYRTLAPQPLTVVASIINRNGTFYAEFFDSDRTPKSRRFSLRTKDKSTARQILARLEQAERLEGWDAWTDDPADVLTPKKKAEPVRLGEAVARYVGTKSNTYTARNYRLNLGTFTEQVGAETLLSRVKPSHVEAFCSESRLSPSTLRYRLTVVRAFVRWAIAEGITADDVTARVKPPKPPAKIPRAVTEEELTAVCAAVSDGKQWMCAAWWFALYTGLRASELARLTWGHVDEDQRILKIEKQKNGKAGTVPLSQKALSVLAELERGESDAPVFIGPNQSEDRKVIAFVSYLSDTFREARRAAGIERPITPHGTRHRFCTRLAEAGKSAFVIQAAARHSNIQTSARYVHIANTELRAELDAVFG